MSLNPLLSFLVPQMHQTDPGGKYIICTCSPKRRRSRKPVWKSSDSVAFEQSVKSDLTESSTSSSDDGSFKALGKKSRSLAPPECSKFYSNHALCNWERNRHSIAPLRRSLKLDEAARWHAEAMAKAGKVRHSNPGELQAHLPTTDHEILGENVAVGDSKGRKCLRNLHDKMMLDYGNYNNIMDRRYTEMGMATGRAQNGQLYICQLFRG